MRPEAGARATGLRGRKRLGQRVGGPVLQPRGTDRPSASVGQPKDEFGLARCNRTSELRPTELGDGTSDAIGIEGEGMGPRTRLPGRSSPPGRRPSGPATVLGPDGQTTVSRQPHGVENDHRCILPRRGVTLPTHWTWRNSEGVEDGGTPPPK